MVCNEAGIRLIERFKHERLLALDVERAGDAVFDLVELGMDENMFAALVSFVLDVGRVAFLESEMLRLLNEGRGDAACDEFAKWIHRKGVVLPGLVERRQAEAALFARPVYDDEG